MTNEKTNVPDSKDSNNVDHSKEPANKPLSDNDESMNVCMEKTLDQFATAFMASARRWEMVVYPSLFAFILLAAYGFFLIYSLTHDVTRVASDMSKITSSMERVADNLPLITENMGLVATQMTAVSKNMVVMTQTVDSQSASMKQMVHHMQGMNMSMNQMRYDFSTLNNSVSRPMSFMNDVMPW